MPAEGAVAAGSGKEVTSPPPPPLRTVQAPFDAYGSSIGQRTCTGTRSSALAFRTTCTLLRESQQRNRRQPHQQERYAPPTYLLCCLKSVYSRFTYANTRGKSAGFRRGVMSPPEQPAAQPLFGRLQADLGLLPPPLPAASSAPLARVAFPDGETTGLPRSATVTVWVRSRLSAGGTTTAPEEFGASEPDHVPFGPSDSASCAWPL
jgi:hypothetical protein